MYNEQISVKDIYKRISHGCGLNDNDFWFHNTWRQNIPLKLKCFMWLMVHNNILAWDNIHKRGFQDHGICSLCKEDLEDMEHIFLSCPSAISVWSAVLQTLEIHVIQNMVSIQRCLKVVWESLRENKCKKKVEEVFKITTDHLLSHHCLQKKANRAKNMGEFENKSV